MRQRGKKERDRGICLLETLIVLFILGIVCEGANIALGKLVNNNLLKQGARSTLELITLKSRQAIISGNDIHILFDIQNNYLAELNFDTNEKNTESTLKRKLLYLPKNIRIVEARFAAGKNHSAILILRANGTSSPGHIILSNKNGHECIISQALRGRREIECSYD